MEVLVIGAVARDILIRHLLGARPERATRDVDVAVAVEDWAAYERLTASIPRSGGASHRFVVNGVGVDIIPFGGIESPGRTVTWPDEVAMDVHGFAEAHRQAVVVGLPGGLEVSVAPLAAQSALEVLAWRDRRQRADAAALLDPGSREAVVRLLEREGVLEVLATRMGGAAALNGEMLDAYLLGLGLRERRRMGGA